MEQPSRITTDAPGYWSKNAPILKSLGRSSSKLVVERFARKREKRLAMMDERFSLKQILGWLAPDGPVSLHRPDFVHQPIACRRVETMARLRQLI